MHALRSACVRVRNLLASRDGDAQRGQMREMEQRAFEFADHHLLSDSAASEAPNSNVGLPISVQPCENWWKMAAFVKKHGSARPLPVRRVGCHVGGDPVERQPCDAMRTARPDI